MHLIGSKAQQFLYRSYVLVVLPQRVLKSSLISIYGLRPLCLVLLAKYPPSHVLGLDYEYPERRNHQVVNLCGAIPGWQRNVSDNAIDFIVEKKIQAEVDLKFPDPSPEPRSGGCDQKKANWVPEKSQEV